MEMVIFSFVLLLFVLGTWLSSRVFYLLEIKRHSSNLASKLGVPLETLDFSFEQMVYYISLPSHMEVIKDVSLEKLNIKEDYSSFIFPRLLGIKIFILDGKTIVPIAYLATKNFRLPSLDRLQNEGKIDEANYEKMSSCKLLQEETLQNIRKEVYKQLRVGRYG